MFIDALVLPWGIRLDIGCGSMQVAGSRTGGLTPRQQPIQISVVNQRETALNARKASEEVQSELGVTEFFRDPEAWKKLKRRIPQP